MIFFVLTVAIVNFALGFALCWVIDHQTTKLTPLHGSLPGVAAVTSAVTVEALSRAREHSDEHSSTTASQVNQKNSAARGKTQATDDSSGWTTNDSEFREQLFALNERIKFVRTTGDKKLAREVVNQLTSIAKLWTSRLESNNQPGNEPKLSTAVASYQVDLCLAQLETTTSNLTLLDWNDDVWAIIKLIEQETAAVERVIAALYA